MVKLSLAQTIIQYVFFYIGVAHTASAKARSQGASGVYVDSDCLLHLPHGADERAQVDRRLIGVAGVVVVNWTKDGFGGGVRLIGEGFVIISMVASACSTG